MQNKEEQLGMAWSDLPDLLVELILERLPLGDYNCSAAICRRWREVQIAHRAKYVACLPFSLPWLVMVPKSSIWFTRPPLFYSPCQRRCYRLRIPEHHWFVKATPGWVMVIPLLPNGHNKEVRFYLLNPISGAKISFPCPRNLLFIVDQLREGFLPTVFLSAPPTDPDAVVLLNGKYSTCLMSLSHGNPEVYLRSTAHKFVSVAGKFYGLVGDLYTKHREVKILVINPVLPKPGLQTLSMELLSSEPSENWPYSFEPYMMRTLWLAEYSGDLLLVVLRVRRDLKEVCEVFKPDWERKVWIPSGDLHREVVVFIDHVSATVVPKARLCAAGGVGAHEGFAYHAHKSFNLAHIIEEKSVSSATQLLPAMEDQLWTEFDLSRIPEHGEAVNDKSRILDAHEATNDRGRFECRSLWFFPTL